jgi:hypothetical protein
MVRTTSQSSIVCQLVKQVLLCLFRGTGRRWLSAFLSMVKTERQLLCTRRFVLQSVMAAPNYFVSHLQLMKNHTRATVYKTSWPKHNYSELTSNYDYDSPFTTYVFEELCRVHSNARLELGFFIRQGVVWTHWLATD